jgi:hypothetical protein
MHTRFYTWIGQDGCVITESIRLMIYSDEQVYKIHHEIIQISFNKIFDIIP